MANLLIGSISTVVDTSELQRRAFNDAFAEHGLDWEWDQQTYRDLLSTAGGRDRIATWAEDTGVDVDADAVHATKSRLFQDALEDNELQLRPGVRDAVEASRSSGGHVAFVTTTSRSNVDSLLGGLGDQLKADDFDLIMTREDVDRGKPDASVYQQALDRLGVSPDEAVAVEDNVDGVAAAASAGVRCIAFPNENTKDHDFARADCVVDRLDASLVA